MSLLSHLFRRPIAARLPMGLAGALAAGLLAAAVGLGLTLNTAIGRPTTDRGNEIWGADYFPNVVLTDQDGHSYRFFDDLVKGKVVSLNFIFTSCAAACGLETARLKEVKHLLGDRVGKDVFFYSISIDPLNDTPAVLKEYAQRYGTGSGWKFLTGKPADIELIQRKLGLFDDYDAGKKLDQHGLDGMIGNQASGRWQKSSPFESPEITATQLGTWLHNFHQEDTRPETDYATAPTRLRQMGGGERTFRTRCEPCHSLQGKTAANGLGPDLLGITQRRPLPWLGRWIQQPDRLLAEKDPTAQALLAQYRGVLMPNLRLSVREVDEVLAFLGEADQGMAAGAARPHR